MFALFLFFNDTATTEIYTLSLHDALPISFANELAGHGVNVNAIAPGYMATDNTAPIRADEARAKSILEDRKSTRLNSSHANISYAVFCLKKKQRPTTACRIPPLKTRHAPI